MKKLYLRIAIVAVLVVVIIFIVFTGPIKNCVDEYSPTFTSYFSFNTEHSNDYQALYFSQSKSIFYGIYAQVDFDSTGTMVNGLCLKSVNYRRTLPFTYKIGFNEYHLNPDHIECQGDSILIFNMVLDNVWSSIDSAYIQFKNPIPHANLTDFNVKRHFTPDTVGEEVEDPCEKESEYIETSEGMMLVRRKAIGLNCIESKLKVVH